MSGIGNSVIQAPEPLQFHIQDIPPICENVAIGFNAGYNLPVSTSFTTIVGAHSDCNGSKNTIIGHSNIISKAEGSVVIGTGIACTESRCVMIGKDGDKIIVGGVDLLGVIKDLQAKVAELINDKELELAYQPGGSGYQEAAVDFKSRSTNINN